MYELTKTDFGKYQRYQLHNPQTGHGFSVVPGRGATVLDLQLRGQHILDGYTTPEELDAGKWGKSSILFPFPNRLDGGQYKWLGKNYQFPINNAATGNAIHGFVRDEAFEVDYIFLTKTSAAIRCFFTYLGDRPYYPFPFSMEIEFTIHDSGKFTMQVEVENFHQQPIPVGFGWHPYFRLSGQADAHSLQLPDCEKVVIDSRMIPTGGRAKDADFKNLRYVEDSVLDTCFHCSKNAGHYEMMLEGDGRYLHIKTPAAQFPFFQVFTPPHRESIALEPMSCNVNAFNNLQGLVSLAPDAKWKGKVELMLR